MAKYYLRKEPSTYTRPEFKRTDGEVVPEKVFQIERRALYKDRELTRFYRGPYPVNLDPRLKLYATKILKNALAQRRALHEYSGEWFDVYDLDTGERVDIGEEAAE